MAKEGHHDARISRVGLKKQRSQSLSIAGGNASMLESKAPEAQDGEASTITL